MITLKSLRIKNIGRFITEQLLTFDGMGNLVQADGENKNTGGSSGSGKTTLFNAADYLFGLNDLPVTVLQSRFTKDGILVIGEMDWDGKPVTLTRGKGKLSILIDGELTEGSNKLVEEKIDTMLGMSRDLFRPIFHKRQKEGGFFLKMGPTEKNEFLTDILGLQNYRKKIETADQKLKLLDFKKKATEVELSNARSALSATQDAILSLGLAPVRDIHQAVVLDLKNKADASRAILDALAVSHKAQLDLVERTKPVHERSPKPTPAALIDRPFDRSKLLAADTELEQVRVLIKSHEQTERLRQATANDAVNERRIKVTTLKYKRTLAGTAQSEAVKLASEIKTIRECVCPTCQQQWIADAAKAKEAELTAKLLAFRAQIQEGAQAEAEIHVIEAELGQLQLDTVPKVTAELTALKEREIELGTILFAERQLESAHAASIAAENKKIQLDHSVAYNAVLNEYHRKVDAANAEYSEKYKVLRLMHDQEMEQVRGQSDLDKRAFEIGANKLQAYEQARVRYEASFNSLKEAESKHLALTESTTETLDAIATECAVAEEVKRAVRSYMSVSFEDALDEIGDSSTRIIRSVPNMANATIQFQGTKETQSGKVKEEVNAVISMDGEEGIDIRSLSGGEGSAADLAIDLAVIELIESRSNKGINVFILDEPFNGLGTTEIEPTLELLKSLKTNKNIIIVDHNDSVKEMVSDRILVTREGLTSSISISQ